MVCVDLNVHVDLRNYLQSNQERTMVHVDLNVHVDLRNYLQSNQERTMVHVDLNEHIDLKIFTISPDMYHGMSRFECACRFE